MLNQILKWSVLLTLWRKYGAAVKVVPLLVLALVIVYAIHGDYIEYAEVSDAKTHIALSFLLKWCAIFLVLITYWLYVKSILSPSKNKRELNSDIQSLRERLSRSRSSSEFSSFGKKDAGAASKKSEDGSVEQTSSMNSKDSKLNADPFSSLRKKKKLRSKAEFILDKPDS